MESRPDETDFRIQDEMDGNATEERGHPTFGEKGFQETAFGHQGDIFGCDSSGDV
jgi:hypothetical protein